MKLYKVPEKLIPSTQMRLLPDGSLPLIQPPPISTNRVLTPSRLFGSNMNNTLYHSNNSRNNSASRFRAPTGNDLVLDDIHLRLTTRSTSRRKQRQWENKNLLDAKTFIDFNNIDDDNDDKDLENVPIGSTRCSAFNELLKPENQAYLQKFMSCREGKNNESTHRRHQTVRPLEGEPVDWDCGHDAWMNIERRIRIAILSSYHSIPFVRCFITNIERILLVYIHQNEVMPEQCFADDLTKELEGQIHLDSHRNLCIPLKESTFNRLLIHGIAQFYGLKSKTIREKATQHKVCVVFKPRTMSNASAKLISMGRFLLLLRVCKSPDTVELTDIEHNGSTAEDELPLQFDMMQIHRANEVETNRTGGDIHVDPDLLSSVIDKREYVEVHRDCDINSSSSSSAEHDGYSRWNKQSSDNGRCVSEDFEFL